MKLLFMSGVALSLLLFSQSACAASDQTNASEKECSAPSCVGNVKKSPKKKYLSSEEADEKMKIYDLNNDGLVSYDEYLTITLKENPPIPDVIKSAVLAKFREIFNSFDIDEDGFLSKDELSLAFSDS